MNIQFLNTQIQKLAKRSQKTISELGGIEQLLDFYKENHTFLSIPMAGRFINEELSAFCNYLMSDEAKRDEQIFKERNQWSNSEIEECIRIYEKEKVFLTSRTKKVLENIEDKFNYSNCEESKSNFIKSIFLNPFDSLTAEGLGPKSKLDLLAIKEKLLCLKLGDQKIIPAIKKQEKIPEKINKEIYEIKNNYFDLYFLKSQIEEVFINGEYSFKKALCILLFNTYNIKFLLAAVLRNNFFSETPLSQKELADKNNCTNERIRQIGIYLKENIIPSAVSLLLDSFPVKPYDLPENNDMNILYLDNFPQFKLEEIDYTPNIEFSNFIYSYLLTENYQLVDKLILPSFRSFKSTKSCLFISKQFMKETDLVKLLNWLDDEIYHFEIVFFDYNLKVLIKRYYEENHIEISRLSIESLYSIIKSLKKEYFEIDEHSLKRINKKNLVSSIVEEVHSFLKDKNEGQTTNEIVAYLNEKEFEIKKVDLLRYLNKNKTTFSSFGMGYWTLTEWVNNKKKPSGSFREIVRNILINRSDPIHISELYEYINSIKKVSLNSIRSNLKSEAEGTFKFFNCSYIGLSNKHYSDYWYQLPKIKPVHINKSVFPNVGSNEEQEINAVCSKYGYPIQHIKFILDCRQGKFN